MEVAKPSTLKTAGLGGGAGVGLPLLGLLPTRMAEQASGQCLQTNLEGKSVRLTMTMFLPALQLRQGGPQSACKYNNVELCVHV